MKHKIPYDEAIFQTEIILAELKSMCEPNFCEYAGSIRRECETVGDVEICCVPKRWLNLFDEPGESMLQTAIDKLVAAGKLSPPLKNGEKYKQFIIEATGQQLDLFITSIDQWPVRFAILTGGKDFSASIVTQVNKRGKLPSHLRIKHNLVWEGDELYHLHPKTEREFLKLCGGWVDPRDRS